MKKKTKNNIFLTYMEHTPSLDSIYQNVLSKKAMKHSEMTWILHDKGSLVQHAHRHIKKGQRPDCLFSPSLKLVTASQETQA